MSTYIEIRDPLRAELHELQQAFIAAGGRINVLSHCERAPARPITYNNKAVSKVAARSDSVKREAETARLMRDLLVVTSGSGSKPRSVVEMRGVLRHHGVHLSAPAIEQLAAKHSIRLRNEIRERS